MNAPKALPPRPHHLAVSVSTNPKTAHVTISETKAEGSKHNSWVFKKAPDGTWTPPPGLDPGTLQRLLDLITQTAA